MNKFFTVSYNPERFPEVDQWLASLPKMKRSERVCDTLTGAITSDRIDRLIALVEQLALGVPVQNAIEKVIGGEPLPADVAENLLSLGE